MNDNAIHNAERRLPPHGGKTRKRKIDPTTWSKEIKKRKRNSGNEMKASCPTSCGLKCTKKISEEERHQLNNKFNELSAEEKKCFYLQTTEKKPKMRTRLRNSNEFGGIIDEEKEFDSSSEDMASRRSFSFYYYFNVNFESKIKVCKSFYLNTLGISESRIRYIYAHKDIDTGTARPSLWGKHTKNEVGPEVKDSVRSHIDEFPRVQSHYCRARTNKEYLETGLSLSKMYDLYVEWMKGKALLPAKKSMYRHIFNYEYNVGKCFY